jgi:SulP family sulfate permease
VNAATGMQLHLHNVDQLFEFELIQLLPALAFGIVLLVAVRVVGRPLVIPAMIAIGLVVFAIGMVVTGSSIGEVREAGWMLGPFETTRLWRPRVVEALGGADWLSVLEVWAKIVAAVFVATLAVLFNISGTELVLQHDLDTDQELRDAGVLNVASGALGGIPGYHALSLTALADRMKVDARRAGLVAALVPLAAVVFGAAVIELIPRMIVGGVLVFIGLSFITEWVWDKRRVLPRLDYGVVLVILIGIIVWGFLPGVVMGLVLAVVLFAISYGRIDLVREVAFGETYRSNVDRPAGDRDELRARADRVQILRLSGFVFFGSTSRLLERIRGRIGETPPRFVVLDLGRATGLDSSAVAAFGKVLRLAEAAGSEVIFTGASDAVRAQLERGGVTERAGVARFEPDLDRGLERCEEELLRERRGEAVRDGGGVGDLPAALIERFERLSFPAGAPVFDQGDAAGDVFVVERGRLRVERETSEGARLRVGTIRPGVIVGEIALYTGEARTAGVVAEEPSEVLRLRRDEIQRIERDEPELASILHRSFATTLAGRMAGRVATLDALLD